MPETRTCTVCNKPFQFMRTVGRPPEKCGAACRRKAASAHHRAYMQRLVAAKRQVDALAA